MNGTNGRLSEQDRVDAESAVAQALEAAGRIDAYESLLDCVWRCEAEERLLDRILAGGTYQ